MLDFLQLVQSMALSIENIFILNFEKKGDCCAFVVVLFLCTIPASVYQESDVVVTGFCCFATTVDGFGLV